jgi:thiosulfate dehydrogenase
MGKFSLGLIVGLVIFPLLAIAYLMAGFAPAAATAPPMPFERFIAGTALHERISREAPKRDTSSFATADLEDGAVVYKKNCAMCHGALSQPAPVIAKGMFPEAPQLLTPDGMVTDDPVGETYWKVKNGIRLSGMPSFASSLMERQMWEVSALLARANNLPPTAQHELQSAIESHPKISDDTFQK